MAASTFVSGCTGPPAPRPNPGTIEVLDRPEKVAIYCPPNPGEGLRTLSGTLPCPPPEVDTVVMGVSGTHLIGRPDGSLVETDADHTDESNTSPVLLRAILPTDMTAASCNWTFDNGLAPISTCRPAVWHRPLSHDQKTVGITLTVTPAQGEGDPVTLTKTFRYRDVIIASLGDSIAAGQGVPERRDVLDGFDASWVCDRSGYAAPARAAVMVQQSMPDATVHFWHLACSGAEIFSDDASPGQGGILDASYGFRGRGYLPSQIDRLSTLVAQAGLPVDRLILTAGVNDSGWGPAAEDCLPQGILNALFGPEFEILSERYQDECVLEHMPGMVLALGSLRTHFDRLSRGISGRLAPPENIYMTGYPDVLESQSPQPVSCAPGEPIAGHGLRVFGAQTVFRAVQDLVLATVSEAGWNYVDVSQAFAGHGVCRDAGVRYFNSAYDSGGPPKSNTGNQHDYDGTWHPNYAGHEAMGNAIYARISPGL